MIQNKILVLFAVSVSVLFVGSTNSIFAAEHPDISTSKLTINGDVYIESKVPTQVPFKVIATDSFNNPIQVECDKTSNTLFKIGKTTVRCMAVDSLGNEIRDSFVVTVGYNIVQIPDWFKQTTEFWTTQTISDEEYFQTLQFLLDEQIIHVPYTKTPNDNKNPNIPVWIKTNAEKWTKGEMSDDEFSICIQWMLSNMARVSEHSNMLAFE